MKSKFKEFNPESRDLSYIIPSICFWIRLYPKGEESEENLALYLYFEGPKSLKKILFFPENNFFAKSFKNLSFYSDIFFVFCNDFQS